jgi:acetamidase/formamidase
MQPSPKLKSFTVKLDPMLGGVGVAPPNGQSISTSDLGAFGGNMDYQGIREGATLHLPVFTRGALLFMGDGHALQGAGELPGQGLETSMDVEFSVRIIENETLGQPWVEDDRFVMVMGIAGSLTEALQRATTGLTRWLEKRYQLNSAEVAMVLGTSIDYEIAEIVDPHVNVVAKISKDTLKQIGTQESP